MTHQDIDSEIDRLLALPWTVVAETTPEGDRLLRVREIPSAIGHGESDEEITQDLRESLESSLRAYLHFGDPIPMPGTAASRPVNVVTSRSN